MDQIHDNEWPLLPCYTLTPTSGTRDACVSSHGYVFFSAFYLFCFTEWLFAIRQCVWIPQQWRMATTPHSRANGAHLDPGIIKKLFSLILFSLLTRCLSLANATWGGFIEFFFGTRDSRSDERAWDHLRNEGDDRSWRRGCVFTLSYSTIS